MVTPCDKTHSMPLVSALTEVDVDVKRVCARTLNGQRTRRKLGQTRTHNALAPPNASQGIFISPATTTIPPSLHTA